MGANASRGTDNQSLVDKLIDGRNPLPPDVERAVRLVDRGEYFEEQSSRAYMDLAWRTGHIHLSAPSIYLSVLQNLELAPGHHFLNVGSGSGYFSTIAGLLLGYNGVNHGIELIEEAVEFARKRLVTFLNESDAPLERDFCIPQFLQGNIFNLTCPIDDRLIANRNRVSDSSGTPSDGDADEHENNDCVISEGSLRPDSQTDRSSSDASSTVSDSQMDSPLESPDPHSSDCSLSVSIDPPPLVNLEDGKPDCPESPDLRWPMYDRVYVGAAVRNPNHLKSILRLLKIGGVLIAPVQDELVKITRLSADRIRRVDLMSVSFAPLIIPPRDAPTQSISPPSREVPTLLRLSGRVLRSILRMQIEQRYNGVPILGRLHEVEPDFDNRKRYRTQSVSAQDPATSSGSSGGFLPNERDRDTVDPSSENPCGPNGFPCDSPSPASNRSSSPETMPPTSAMGRLLRHLLRYSGMMSMAEFPAMDNQSNSDQPLRDLPEGDAGTGPTPRSRLLLLNLMQNHESRTEDEPDESPNETPVREPNRLVAVFEDADDVPTDEAPDHVAAPDTASVPNDPTTVTDARTSSARRSSKKRRLKYHPPSYRYRDEMRSILSNELNLPEFFIREVFLL